MAEQARALAREVELYADKEKEWARQGTRKTQENRALLQKVDDLETALRAEKRDKELLQAQLLQQHMKEVREHGRADGMAAAAAAMPHAALAPTPPRRPRTCGWRYRVSAL